MGYHPKDQKWQTHTDLGNGSKSRGIPSKFFKATIIPTSCSPVSFPFWLPVPTWTCSYPRWRKAHPLPRLSCHQSPNRSSRNGSSPRSETRAGLLLLEKARLRMANPGASDREMRTECHLFQRHFRGKRSLVFLTQGAPSPSPTPHKRKSSQDSSLFSSFWKIGRTFSCKHCPFLCIFSMSVYSLYCPDAGVEQMDFLFF